MNEDFSPKRRNHQNKNSFENSEWKGPFAIKPEDLRKEPYRRVKFKVTEIYGDEDGPENG